MDTVLYYFTGTGNSLALGRFIQRETSAKLIPLTAVPDSGPIEVQEEAVGILAPVHYGDLPSIVKSFLRRLANPEKMDDLLAQKRRQSVGQNTVRIA